MGREYDIGNMRVGDRLGPYENERERSEEMEFLRREGILTSRIEGICLEVMHFVRIRR